MLCKRSHPLLDAELIYGSDDIERNPFRMRFRYDEFFWPL